MENSGVESIHARSKQSEKEHCSKKVDEKEGLEEDKRLTDLKAFVHQSTVNPENPDVSHQKILDVSIEQNATSTKNLGKINGKVKYGLVEELRNSVKEAASYICEAKNHFADIQSTVVFYMDLDVNSGMKRILKEKLISYCHSITKLLQLEHEFLNAIELGQAKFLNGIEPNVEITASCEELKKSVDQLTHGVRMLAGSLQMLPPVIPKYGHTTRVPSDLPIDVIREEIYPKLPASDILCARLVNKIWYMAYTSGSLGEIQPARGGSIPLGFLFATDKLQRRAAAGLKLRHHFKGLEDKYPARDAQIIASSCGLYLIHMRNPEGMVILNPAVGQSRDVYPPVSNEECAYTGMLASFTDGSQVATRYSVVVPYCPPFINAFAPNTRIRFRTWNSGEGVWRINPAIIELEDFSPRNVVTVGDTIYFHISRDELIFYNVDLGEPGHLDMPVEVVGIIEIALCNWKGALGILSYDMVDDVVEIYTLEDNAWIRKEGIAMQPIVDRNRFSFEAYLVI